MKEVRETKQLCQFTDTMREITETFQTVSKAILKIVRALKDNDSYTTARRIDKLQDLEQLKLKLVSLISFHIFEGFIFFEGLIKNLRELFLLLLLFFFFQSK